MATRRETVEEKGWRLFTSGAVKGAGWYWQVRGDSGEYEVISGRCECPSYSRCSHEVAVEYARGITPAPVDTVEVDAERLVELLRVEAEEKHDRERGQAYFAEKAKSGEGLFA